MAETIEIRGASCQWDLNIIFNYVQQHDGKPAYVGNNKYYIYYLLEFGRWYVGDSLGSNTVRVRISSAANDVPTSGWQEFCGSPSGWTDSELVVDSGAARCTDCSAGKYSPTAGATHLVFLIPKIFVFMYCAEMIVVLSLPRR